MTNSIVIDLCSDDEETWEPSMKRSKREIDSSPSVCTAPISRQFWKAGNYEVPKGAHKCKAATQYGENHMRIHPMFLHSNATSHKWAFGAVAELLDNAFDEIHNGATFVSIGKMSTPRNWNPALLIRDDGGGMDPDTIRRCMSFGFSDKESKFTIGQYGNGFKTSSMRLGADVIVFSRHLKSRKLTQSAGLLSYTFLTRMGYDKIVVPMVDYEFNSSAKKFMPLIPPGEDHFSSNLTMLLQWSPYSTEEELLKQFDDIGDHGTKLIIYNLWLNDDGDLELDFESDPEDIRINSDNMLNIRKPTSGQYVASQYQYSLRAYASILYRQLPQDFRIILRGRDVQHLNVASDLKSLQFIKHKPQNDGDVEALQGEVLTAIGFSKDAAQVNIHGFNFYHRNRLILPFWRALKYTTNSLGRGVVGVLEPDCIHPTHNKQDFENNSLFQKLEARLKQMTVEYWNMHCQLFGYDLLKRKRIKALCDQESPSSRTRNYEDQPLLLTQGSQNDSSRASSSAVGSLEGSEATVATTSDVSSRVLIKSADMKYVRSPEGFIKKRKHLDPPVKLQLAKTHMRSCGTDALYITEQPESSVENMRTVVVQENRRLKSELQNTEMTVQELELKVQQLKDELEKEQQHLGELDDELMQTILGSLESYTKNVYIRHFW